MAHCVALLAAQCSSTPMMSLSFMIRSSLASILTSVPDHLPNSTLSPFLRSMGIELAGFVAAARADGDDLALLRLLARSVGDDDAAGRLGFRVRALDHHAIVERTKLHCCDAPIASGAAQCGRLKVCFGAGVQDWHSLLASANTCPLVGLSVQCVKEYRWAQRQRCQPDLVS